MAEGALLPVPCLVVLVGPSASGKSTWAAAQFAPGEIVSSDRLRAGHAEAAGRDPAGIEVTHLAPVIAAFRR